MDCGAKAPSYVETVMGGVSWNNADRLLSEVTGNSARE
jgi:hypothetical protein